MWSQGKCLWNRFELPAEIAGFFSWNTSFSWMNTSGLWLLLAGCLADILLEMNEVSQSFPERQLSVFAANREIQFSEWRLKFQTVSSCTVTHEQCGANCGNEHNVLKCSVKQRQQLGEPHKLGELVFSKWPRILFKPPNGLIYIHIYSISASQGDPYAKSTPSPVSSPCT